MNPHGVEILDGADDDHGIVVVAHDLELILLPAQHRLLDEDGGRRAVVEPLSHHPLKALLVIGDSPTCSPEGIARSDDSGEADLPHEVGSLVERGRHPTLRGLEADAGHRLLEGLPVLALVNGLVAGADQFHPEPLEDTLLVQHLGKVQCGLSAEGGEQGVGPLGLYDLLDRFEGQRFDVGPVGHFGVGHDGCGVRVDQYDPVADPLEGLAGLGSRVVKLGGLADLNGARAGDQDRFDVVASGHGRLPALQERRIAWVVVEAGTASVLSSARWRPSAPTSMVARDASR